MPQKSANATVPILSGEWVGFPQVTSALLHVTLMDLLGDVYSSVLCYWKSAEGFF